MIGLDVGTSATKAVRFRVGSSERVAVQRDYPLEQPAPGQEVQDPEVIVAAVLDALAECGPADAVALGAAMHGVIGLDASYVPVTPLLTWADGRAVAQAAALRDRAVELLARTGTPVHPMSPLAKIRWFSECAPDLGVRWWVGLKDYVVYRLTGQLVTELSSASATGMLDLAARSWDEEAVGLAGTTVASLPPVRSPFDVLDRDGVPVVLGAADGPLGNLGTGALAPGVASVSLGTSGAVRTMVSSPRADPSGALFCYALTEDLWAVGGAISNGGIVVRWAGEALGFDGDAAVLEAAASVPAGADGLVMLPYLMAERAPAWDPALPGAVLGLRRRHTRAHVVRAAIEGVCRQLALILERLDGITEVRATGGAFRSALWRDVLAATLDRPLLVTGDADGTARGAAALGLVALGRAPDLTEALALLPGSGAERRVAPDPELVRAYAGDRVGELLYASGWRSR